MLQKRAVMQRKWREIFGRVIYLAEKNDAISLELELVKGISK